MNHNVLRVIPYYLPCKAGGGALNYAYYVSKEQVKRGDKVTIVTTNIFSKSPRKMMKKYKKQEMMDGILVRRHEIRFGFMSYWFTPTIIRDLSKINCDIIDINCLGNFQTDIANIIGKIRRKPIVVTTHGVFWSNSFFKKILYQTYSNTIGFFTRFADRIIVASNFEKEICENYGFGSEKIMKIPLGIDIKEFKGKKKPHKIKKIVYVGRIAKVKGLDTLVKAFSKVLKNIDNVKLILIGPDYDYTNKLKKMINKLGISENVIFTGYKTKKEISKILHSSDVGVLPSKYESFGLVLLEMGACKLPVVASVEGSIPEIVKDGSTGFLVNCDDLDYFAEKMIKILTNEKLRNKMGSNAFNHVSNNFSWEKVVDELDKVYNKLKVN